MRRRVLNEDPRSACIIGDRTKRIFATIARRGAMSLQRPCDHSRMRTTRERDRLSGFRSGNGGGYQDDILRHRAAHALIAGVVPRTAARCKHRCRTGARRGVRAFHRLADRARQHQEPRQQDEDEDFPPAAHRYSRVQAMQCLSRCAHCRLAYRPRRRGD